MQAFSLGQVNVPGQRNYVFVDEHNRHKRLKVMRACEGCRRRKIRCDAATTNSWPCSACNRLKLQCVPPTPFDQDLSGPEPDHQNGSMYQFMNALDLHRPLDQSVHLNPRANMSDSLLQTTLPPSPPVPPPPPTTSRVVEKPQASPQLYDSRLRAPPSINLDAHSSSPLVGATGLRTFTSTESPPIERPSNSPSDQGSYTIEELSDAFGILKVDETGVAPYLQRPSKHNAEPAAPLSEQEIELPPLETSSGMQMQIPTALMPASQEASHYFRIFFSEVHPYVPVVVRSHFYQQWNSDRQSISPLLLEAMLACAGRYSDFPAHGARWLALANKHEDSFLDTPRLSTIQALLLLLKAREAAPKRGYYYRSWMTCKTIASMAKDLELHEHHDLHRDGNLCESSTAECLTKSRVWQTLMVCETMIGGPQGRYDYEVDLDTVDLTEDPPCSNIDRFEAQISRQSSYFIRNVRNIRAIAEAYHALKKSRDWASHPKFVANKKGFDTWSDTLPPDLKLTLPADGSAPVIRSHFVGNMHTHYHLGRIMLQRPQMMACKSFGADSEWKQLMTLCYDSAQILCRIQEAILDKFGLHGLLCMQRGINFTIYAILTCIMLHLIAVTSPDPDFHTHARDYFTRHMCILEQCMNAWPMEEMKAQIEALREAFSADKDKPFELKASFPFGTPSDTYAASPPPDSQYYQTQIPEEERSHPPANAPYSSLQVMTPPVSRGSGFETSQLQPNNGGMVAAAYDPATSTNNYGQAYPQPALTGLEEINWNPAPILAQWDEAFAIPPAALAPTPLTASTPSSVPLSMLQQQPHQMLPISPPRPSPYQAQFPPPGQQPSIPMPSATYSTSFVSPKQWQQSVANVMDPYGHKRRLLYSELEQQASKRAK